MGENDLSKGSVQEKVKQKKWRWLFVIFKVMLLVILLLIICHPIFWIVKYLNTEHWIFISKIYNYYSYSEELSQRKIEAIEEEFGFLVPPGWEITQFEISSMRGTLRTGLTMEGKLLDIDDIRDYVPYTLPDNIITNMRERNGYFYSESCKISEITDGRVQFWRTESFEDDYYKMVVNKAGLKNKCLHRNMKWRQ
jgi:hypothetical protein